MIVLISGTMNAINKNLPVGEIYFIFKVVITVETEKLKKIALRFSLQ
jgi:hypothetical protein